MRNGSLLPRTLIRRAAHEFHGRTAILASGERRTFAEVYDRICRLGDALAGLDVNPGDAVAVLTDNTIEHLEMSLGFLSYGAVAVNVNPKVTGDELAWQLAHCRSSVAFVGERHLERVEAVRDAMPRMSHVISLGERGGTATYRSLVESAEPREPRTSLSPTDLAYVRYTSGTTGKPKAVAHDQATVLAVTRNLLLDYVPGFGPDDVLAPVQGLYHGAGWFMLPSWIRGSALSVSPDFSPARVLEQLVSDEVSVVKTVPTVLRRLIRHEGFTRDALPRLASVIYGGSPIDRATLGRAIEEFGPIFTQLYGQAEAPMTIAVLRGHEHVGERLASVGKPVTFAEVELRHDDGSVAAPDEAAELCVRGDHLMRGYLQEDGSLHGAPAPGDWVHTGDIARRDADGFLYLVDRKNQVIITGGLNVYPAEIERVLYDHPQVAEAAVVGAPDDDWGERIVAIVVPTKGAVLQEEDIIEFCAPQLPRFKQPREVIFRDELPISAAGKVLRREIRDSLWPTASRKVN